MDLQHPCTLIWDGTKTEVCASQWSSCWTEEKCNSVKPKKEETQVKTQVDENGNVDPKSSFNIDSLYLPLFIITLYLNQ